MEKMRVTRGEEAHLPQVIELWKDMMDRRKVIDPHFARAPEGHLAFERHLRGCMASEDHLLLVALEGDQVLGYLLAHLASRPPVFQDRVHGEVSDLTVRADQRRRGVGSRMFKGAVKWFQTKGIDQVEARASPHDPESMGYWKEMGFAEVHRTLHRRL